MYNEKSYPSHRTDRVDFGKDVNTLKMPFTVQFSWPDSKPFEIKVEAYQFFRRSIPLTHDGSEHTVMAVKYFKGLTGLSLKQCLDIVKWFEANFTRDAS